MKLFQLFLIAFFLFITPVLIGQNLAITYSSIENGTENESGSFTMECSFQLTYLSPEDAKIRTFIDYQRKLVSRIIDFQDSLYREDTPFDSLPQGILTDQKDTILGFECQHKSYVYFSNKIDVYYTEKTNTQGSPYSNFIPSEKALVLRVLINENRELIATSIDTFNRESNPPYPYLNARQISRAKFEELRIKSRYTSLSVFKDQQINFDPGIEKPDWNDENTGNVLRLANGTIVLKKIQLPDILTKGAYTYVKLSCRSNGDAYDRTGSVFAIWPGEGQTMLDALRDSIKVVPSFSDRSGKTYHGYRNEPNFTPAIELMRFFTSFGIDHFNDKRVINNYTWEKTATYKQEISQLIPSEEKEIWIGVFIGNYNKGGHIVDLDLEFFPSFEDNSSGKKWIQPLFNTVNIMEMAGQEYPRFFKTDTLKVEFEIPDSIDGLQLLYTSTGHGGWGEGDEFNPRLNEIFIDGQSIFNVVPWRTDCATYRLYNPASGNFGNGLSSSDFSRSNWCPATSTPPYIVPLPDIKAGVHTIEVVIDQGEDAGNSFNAWNVSGVLSGTKNK